MAISIIHLILDIKKQKSTEKISENQLQLEQGKVGLDVITKLFPMKEYIDLMLKDPEAFKKKVNELKETAKKIQKAFKTEEESNSKI